MGADIQLTAVLIYVLRKNRTGLRRYVGPRPRTPLFGADFVDYSTDSIIDILVLYAISTGQYD